MARRSGWHRLHLAAAMAATILVPSAALQAQSASRGSPPTDDEIVVTGVRDQLKTIDRFVNGLTIVRDGDPLSRYEAGKYCPAVLGLSERFNAQINSRMRAVAAAAGVVPSGAKCAPTALVIFVDNKSSFLTAFRKQHPVYFEDLQSKEQLPPPEKGPAIAWHLVQLLDPQGSPVRRSVSGYGVVESPAGGSRLRSMVQPVVVMAVVVIERKALLGLSATQIADYALMRTLTDRVRDVAKMPGQLTILQSLTAPMGAETPASLTEWDFAYVKSRYSGDDKQNGYSHGAIIRRDVRRVVKAQPGDD